MYSGYGWDHIVTGEGDDVISSGDGRDTIMSGPGDDIINAGEDPDKVHGGEGQDIIYLESWDDVADGGAGDDILIGGWGGDTLTGGMGSDTFVYIDFKDSYDPGFQTIYWGYDTITDKKKSIDKIDLRALGALCFIGQSEFSTEVEVAQLRYMHHDDKTTLLLDKNGNGHTDFQISLSGTLALSRNDLLIVESKVSIDAERCEKLTPFDEAPPQSSQQQGLHEGNY